MARKTVVAAAEWSDATSLRPWAANPRKLDVAIEPVARSLLRFGFGAPIVARAETREIIAGHTRLAALTWLTDKVIGKNNRWRKRRPADGPYIVPGAPGPGQVPVRFLDLSESEAHALALADNRLGELAEWDDGKLGTVLAELAAIEVPIDDLGWSSEDLAEIIAGLPGAGPATTYTAEIKAPIYEPRGTKPKPSDLYDRTVADKLLGEIEAADLLEDVAAFLRFAAERHVAFDFHNIAEFYAHADAPTQRLMENSALVIVDFKRAVELGFVRVSERLAALADTEPSTADAS